MKLKGKFIVREIVDDIVAIPVGNIALEFNGMIILNAVSKVIWNCIEKEVSLEEIVHAVTEKFDVTETEAKADVEEFLEKLRNLKLLEE